ncbi:hypothetical protein MMC06_002088 [Schaereria dolodes]|nr:hypothetical protein [Schaereria dolodes]
MVIAGERHAQALGFFTSVGHVQPPYPQVVKKRPAPTAPPNAPPETPQGIAPYWHSSHYDIAPIPTATTPAKSATISFRDLAAGAAPMYAPLEGPAVPVAKIPPVPVPVPMPELGYGATTDETRVDELEDENARVAVVDAKTTVRVIVVVEVEVSVVVGSTDD